MEESNRTFGCLKIAGIATLLLVITLAVFLWWRQGQLIVEVDEARLEAIAAASEREQTEPVEFTVCTYNVQARPWFDDSVHKFQYISPLLNQHDFIGIQECFKDHDLLYAKAEHPVKIYHGTFKHPFKIVGSGLGILANFPLLKTEAKNYDALGEFQNWPASKGLVMGRFDVNGMIVDFYTTHIEAGRSPEALQAKIGQGEEIIDFITTHSPAEHTVIFVGDFNMRPSRGPEDKEANKDNPRVFVFDKIKESLNLRDASDEINGPVGEEIDRVLFRPADGLTMETLSWVHDTPEYYDPDKKPLSDHEPVIVRFKLSPAQAG